MSTQTKDVKLGTASSTVDKGQQQQKKVTFEDVADGLIEDALKGEQGSSGDDKVGKKKSDQDVEGQSQNQDGQHVDADSQDDSSGQDDEGQDKSEDDSDSSGSKKEQDEDDENEDKSENEDADKDEDEENVDDDDKSDKFDKTKKHEDKVAYKRFKEVNDELVKLKPIAEDHKKVISFCRENQISIQQYREGLDIMALINKDPKAALTKVQALADQLKVVAGQGLPTDLQAELDEAKVEVQEGTMSQKRFNALEARLKETAQLRVNNSRVTQQSKQTSDDQLAQAQRELYSQLNQWSSSKRKVDPAFKPKADDSAPDGKFEFFIAKNQQLWNLNPPQSIADAVRLAEETYTIVQQSFKQFNSNANGKPTGKKVITSTGSTSRKRADDTPPKTMDDVANKIINSLPNVR